MRDPETAVKLRVVWQHLANVLDARQRWFEDFDHRASTASNADVRLGLETLAAFAMKDVSDLEWPVDQLAQVIGETEHA